MPQRSVRAYIHRINDHRPPPTPQRESGEMREKKKVNVRPPKPVPVNDVDLSERKLKK